MKKFFLSILILLLLSSSLWATTINVGTPTTDKGAKTTFTWSHTCTDGSDRILIVAISKEHATSIVSTVTYNGVVFKRAIKGTQGDNDSEIWFLLNGKFPTVSGEYDVSVVFTGATNAVCMAVQIDNAAQEFPITATSSATTATVISTNITTLLDGSFIIDSLSLSEQNTTTPTDPQVELHDVQQGTMTGASSYKILATAGDTSMGQTPSVLTNRLVLPVAAFAPVYGGMSRSYYVDGTNGNDSNNGLSPTTAWKTIDKAWARALEGDTINVLAGIYDVNLDATYDGIDGFPIIFQRHGSGNLVIKPTATGTLALNLRAKYWIFNRTNFDTANITGAQHGVGVLGGNNSQFNYCLFLNHGSNTFAYVQLSINSTTDLILNNCGIIESKRGGVAITNGSSVKMRNSIVVGNASRSGYGMEIAGGCTLDMDYCLVSGNSIYPDNNISGSWTDGGHNVIGVQPLLKSSRIGSGIVCFASDDDSLDYFEPFCSTLNNYGHYGTLFIYQDGIAGKSNYQTRLQALHDAGNEIAAHGVAHQDVTKTNSLTIQYVGAAGSCTMSIANNALTTSEGLNIDLTNASYDTIGELVTYINGLADYTCTKHADSQSGTRSKSLADVTNQDIKTSGYLAQFNTTRLVQAEVLDEKTWLENLITGLTVKTHAWSGGKNNATVQGLIRDGGILGARGIEDASTRWLDSVPVFATFGAELAAYVGVDEATTRKNIRHLAELIRSAGLFVVLYAHNSTECSIANFGYIVDELNKADGVSIMRYVDAIEAIRLSHSTADNLVWTKIYSDSSDFHLQPTSPCRDAGVNVGLAQDYAGRPVPQSPGKSLNAPDIGAYEFEVRRKGTM